MKAIAFPAINHSRLINLPTQSIYRLFLIPFEKKNIVMNTSHNRYLHCISKYLVLAKAFIGLAPFDLSHKLQPRQRRAHSRLLIDEAQASRFKVVPGGFQIAA